MITPALARNDYDLARRELQRIATDVATSDDRRTAALGAIDQLNRHYLSKPQLEIAALNVQYHAFLAEATGWLERLAAGRSVRETRKLAGMIVTGRSRFAEQVERSASAARPGRETARRTRDLEPPTDSQTLRILCVHGVGHQEDDSTFESTWTDAITRGLSEWTLGRPFQVEFVAYDDLFAANPPTALQVAKAVIKLTASGIIHGIDNFLRPRRGFGEIRESVRWTAGMVVQWADNSALRAAARKRVIDHTVRFDPHVVLAHSLGTLLSYDAFARPEGRPIIAGRTFVSFGSQIGNAFVCSTLGGRINPMAEARHWYHLFNPNDDAFTAQIRLVAPNFEQITTEFDLEGILDHDAPAYLRHANTINIVWRTIASSTPTARRLAGDISSSAVALTTRAQKARPAKVGKPTRRALLVGINDYPDPADRLEGCVNDVFLMSSLLQESGFAPDDIRVVLNNRATARGILDRLEWLLEDTEDGQDRVFYYSGHGAQIPGSGTGETTDRKDECLCAYDFDWSRDHAVTDDQFYELYSQLPYDAQFLTIFDCCHSGGMTREGSARVRGLTPPDDIRHRELKWDAGHEMWVPRNFSTRNELVAERKKKPQLFGATGAVNRLGRSGDLRLDERRFKRARKEYDHHGPFLPIIIQACREKQFSYEYRHGVQSYGAFTYSLGLALRGLKSNRKMPTWENLVQALTGKLDELDYDQTPVLVCPTVRRNQPIPWKRG